MPLRPSSWLGIAREWTMEPESVNQLWTGSIGLQLTRAYLPTAVNSQTPNTGNRWHVGDGAALMPILLATTASSPDK